VSRGLVLGLVLAHAAGARALQAQGGPPLETDDPGTPGAGHVELNIALAAERESGGTVYDAPRLDANLGVGARVQLKIEVPWRVATRSSEPTRTGVGNVVLGVKWRFAESAEVAISTYPQVALEGFESASAKGLADSGTTVLLPVEVAWHVGPLSMGAEVGYQRAQGESEIVYGVAAAHQTRPSLEVLGECHGNGDTHFTGIGMRCGAGLRWVVGQSVSVLAALTAGVAGPGERRPERRLYAGVQLRW
jgi:hypothetical protein